MDCVVFMKMGKAARISKRKTGLDAKEKLQSYRGLWCKFVNFSIMHFGDFFHLIFHSNPEELTLLLHRC